MCRSRTRLTFRRHIREFWSSKLRFFGGSPKCAGPVRDGFFNDTYVNYSRRIRDFVSGLPKCAGPVRDETFNDTHMDSSRRHRVFFSGLPKCAGPVRDKFLTKHT